MKKIFLFVIVISFVFIAEAQQKSILTIDGRDISVEEFDRIYRKNNTQLSDESEIKSPKDYLQMFVDFKLKVIEAENRGMDTISDFVNELDGYRKELAKPYLTDVSITDSMIKVAYYRTIYSVDASHILLQVEDNATPEDTASVYNKLIEIRDQCISGEKTFEELAVEYSDDPSAKTNNGSLGYFSAFQMVTAFENAAYNTPVGEVSMPIRTRFGYHLIKTHDVKASIGEVKVAHILKMFSDRSNISEQDEADIKAIADSLYALIQDGGDFSELAKENSDDRRSATSGGEINWISSNFGVKEFAEAAFALEIIGDVSQPIRTSYGYHIIKLIEKRPPPTFEEKEKELTDKVKNDPERSKYSLISFIEKRKSEYSFVANAKAIKTLKDVDANSKNDTINRGETLEIANEWLFSLADKKYTTQDYVDYVFNERPEADQMLVSKLGENFDQYVEETIVKYEDSRLEEKYLDFRYLMQEYHDGILLFNIMEQEVWNKAISDTIGLEKYYDDLEDKYTLGEHFCGVMIKCDTQQTRDSVDMMLEAGVTSDEIEAKLNTDKVKKVTFTPGKWEKGDNLIVDYFMWDGPKFQNIDENLNYLHGEILESGIKTLEDARGLYVSDYQDYLDKAWMKSLRERYKVTVNKKALKKIKPLKK